MVSARLQLPALLRFTPAPCSCTNLPDALLCAQVAEQGSHSQLLAQQGIYWGLVRRQQKGLGPGDRDLSPREKDPPMLSSRDWDYGEGGPLQSRWVGTTKRCRCCCRDVPCRCAAVQSTWRLARSIIIICCCCLHPCTPAPGTTA